MREETKTKLDVLRRKTFWFLRKEREHTVSFVHAWHGLLFALKTQPNFRYHFLAAVAVVIAGLYFNIGKLEWVVLAFTIMTVLVAETINTAIEQVVDLITDKYHLNAKHAKDVAAGMVLVAAVFAVVVGSVVFIPYILEMLTDRL